MGENSTFDEIMKNCPFLKQIIENKIAEEVQTRDAKIQQLETTIAQQDNAIMELTTIMATMGGAN